ARRAGARSPHALSAIAHSTWFQGSTCPSGQPMAPSGCWPAAMLRPVASTCSAVRTPGTDGSTEPGGTRAGRAAPARLSRRGMCPLRLLGRVDDEALADERIEHVLGEPGRGRLLHDVPDQHAVIGAGQRMVVVTHPDRALEPPVRRVQCMGVYVTAPRPP